MSVKSIFRIGRNESLSVLSASNTIFIIEDDFDLAGGDVTVGSYSTLEFRGGSFFNSGTTQRKINTSTGVTIINGLFNNVRIQVYGSDNSILNCTVNNPSGCIRVESDSDFSNLLIADCHLESITEATGDNSHVYNGLCVKLIAGLLNTSTIHDIHVRNTSFVFNSMGVETQSNGAGQFERLDISGCTFSLCITNYKNGMGISIPNKGQNARIENNVFCGNKVGIEVGFKDVVISGNSFTDSISYDITSSLQEELRVHISGNTFKSPLATIFFMRASRIDIMSNSMYIRKIQFQGTSDILLMNNRIITSESFLVNAFGSTEPSNIMIKGNYICNTGNSYIVYASGTGFVFVDNTIETSLSNYYYFTGNVTDNAIFSNNINVYSLFNS